VSEEENEVRSVESSTVSLALDFEGRGSDMLVRSEAPGIVELLLLPQSMVSQLLIVEMMCIVLLLH
jgi:hypothetical protein